MVDRKITSFIIHFSEGEYIAVGDKGDKGDSSAFKCT